MARLKPSLVISHSDINGNYFVKENSNIIAGFKNKVDAELFIKAKENDTKRKV